MQTPLMQKVAQVAPQKFDFIMKTASEVRESPFKEEIVGQLDSLIKKANQSFMGRAGGALGTAAAGIGATVATGIAYNLAGDMFDAVKRGITKSRGYKSMLTENPDLQEHSAKSVQKIYSTLHRFNPDFAMDPTVAGAFVRRQVALGEFDTKMLTEAISSRKNLKDVTGISMPGRLPWDSADEKKTRSLMAKKLEQDIAHSGEEHARRGAAHAMQTEEHGRRGQSHKMQMQRGQADLNRMGIMGPLELQALQAKIPADDESRQINFRRYQMAEEKHPYDMEKLKDDLHRRKNPPKHP